MNAALLPKSGIKRNTESKHHGLLMLEFSNSQSCKEFTLEGEFTVLHVPEIWRRKAALRIYID
jgi:hypothetical protein